MDNLKAIIIRCFKEEDHIKSSSWMSGNIDIIIQYITMRCYIELSEYRPIPDIEQVFLRIVHNRYSLVAMVTVTVCSFSISGWDLVIQGLIKLAFVLTDSCHPKNTTCIYI